MNAKKIFLFILGLIIVIGGLYCASSPGMTYLTMIWVIGFAMIFHAIEDFFTYSTRKSLGLADGWNLAGSIIAFLFGLAIMISGKTELVTGIALLYFLFAWIIIAGIINIVASFQLRKFQDTGNAVVDGYTSKWGWYVLLGVIMVIGGIFGFAHPVLGMITAGFIVGINIVILGIDMMIGAFAM